MQLGRVACPRCAIGKSDTAFLNMLQEIDCFERSAHVSLSLQAAQQLDAKPVVPLYTQCALARGP